MLKFTQEIKDKWLEALKSGKYTQGFGSLKEEYPEIRHCCIGVLGDIIPELNNKENMHNQNPNESPYIFLKNNNIDVEPLWFTNDEISYKNACYQGKQKRDYSNVIPLIEQLPVKD